MLFSFSYNQINDKNCDKHNRSCSCTMLSLKCIIVLVYGMQKQDTIKLGTHCFFSNEHSNVHSVTVYVLSFQCTCVHSVRHNPGVLS